MNITTNKFAIEAACLLARSDRTLTEIEVFADWCRQDGRVTDGPYLVDAGSMMGELQLCADHFADWKADQS